MAEYAPQICISNPKETNYFVRKSINSISDSDPLKEHIMNMSRLNTKDFLDSFDKGGHKVFGEASVHNFMYLDEFISEVPRNLKIILILRDPIQEHCPILIIYHTLLMVILITTFKNMNFLK